MKYKHPVLSLILTIAVLLIGMAFIMGTGGGGGGGGTPPPGGTASGAIVIGQGHVLDGDTKDPNNPDVDNDNTPQPVLIPSTVGGYASVSTDPLDVYRIKINGPVSIILAIADSDNSDLDLFLYDLSATNKIAESIGTGPFEIIETNQTGELLVIVDAFSGGGNYVLSLGVNTSSSTGTGPLLGDALMANAEFVSDEIIIKPAAGATMAQAASTISAMANYFGMEEVVGSATGPYLMKVSQFGQSPFQAQRSRNDILNATGNESEEEEQRNQTLEIIKMLRKHPSIAYAEPNYIYQIHATPDDEFYNLQWHYSNINLPQAWDITTGSDSVVVGVIDTGVLLDHPDLRDRILRDGSNNVIGYDFISDDRRDNDEDPGIDPNPDDSGDSGIAGVRSSFHGSHVAGTIGASTDNSIGVAGVDWNAKIMPLRALGVGGGTNFDIAQAILYAAGEQTVYFPSVPVSTVKANVINLSLGPSNPNCNSLPLSTTLEDAIIAAQAANVIVVIAAGNDNCDVPTPMSTIAGVISVSAVDALNQKAPYSNFGATVDVAAPGGNASVDLNGDGQRDGVYSTLADDSSGSTSFGYAFYQGTSMAAPHVAGVIALMLAANNTLTPTDINELLAGSHLDPNAGPITQDIGDTGRDDNFGYGLIDALQAVNVASNIDGGLSPITGPALNVFPSPLNFSITGTIKELTLNNPGTENVEITSITPDAAATWIAVTNLPTLPFSLLPGSPNSIDIEVNVDRIGLDDGAYLGSITIISDLPTPTVVPVSMQVQSNVGGDVGTVYVLVLDPSNFETLDQTTTSVSQGYLYQTPRIAEGTYLIAAGTDHNDDGSVCDAGEACGIYRLIDNPVEITIEVDVNKAQIDFPISYDFFASNPAVQIFGNDERVLEGFRRKGFKRIR